MALRAADPMGFIVAPPCRLKDFAAEFFNARSERLLGGFWVVARTRAAHANTLTQVSWTRSAFVPLGTQAGVGFAIALPGFLYNDPA
ncbi:hypothetical protein SGFS_013300 [Streptomyces graminofaciens]|uniref:Uncharacterized protein n=1 Tax=Streptomyces graminofaciens TaxID=68212 RepID=A0ABM7F2Y7_9ACTN|nr:hypothetical protein SGFS_013300 [Streptomyces graminofaciens]